jgi:hypothetical protein
MILAHANAVESRHRKEEIRMTLPQVQKWIARLQGAQSDEAIVEIVGEYLATWTPSEIGEIPKASWPGEGRSKPELLNAAVQVKVDELRAEEGPAQAMLQELGAVLAAASTRFGQLSGPFRAPAP